MIRNHVYVLSSEHGPTKVGVSISPERRAKECARDGFGATALAYSLHAAFFSDLVEARAHAILAQWRVRGEWFSVGVTEARAAVDQASGEICCRPFPAPHCECAAPHALTCGSATGQPGRCDCECHGLGVSKSLITQRRRGEWAPRITAVEVEEDDEAE